MKAEYGLSFDSEVFVLEQLASVGILTAGIHWQFKHDSFEAYFAATRILTGLEEDDPVDLQIWTGPLAKDFLPVVDFLRQMASPAQADKVLAETANIPEIWSQTLKRS